MSNYIYLVTYGKLLYDKNDFLPFLVKTTAPISLDSHFTELKNKVVAVHTHSPDEWIPVSVSLLLSGTAHEETAEFSVISYESVHPEEEFSEAEQVLSYSPRDNSNPKKSTWRKWLIPFFILYVLITAVVALLHNV